MPKFPRFGKNPPIAYPARMPADATTRLHAGEDSEALWNGVVLPWVLEVREGAWRAAKPVAVLAPSRNYAFFLKHRLLDAGIGFAGIRFWTPSDARAFLSARLENFPHTIEPHGLRLLFAAEAERLADNPTARAVARDPSGLVQALGRLSAAGWDWKSLGQRSLDPLTDAVARRLDAAGLATPEQADLRLAAEAAGIGRPIGALLVIGFDGAHWDAWQLLVAAARCSERAAICLLQPRFKSEEIDQAWFSSWEEFAGEAVATDTDVTPARPFAALAERMETQVQLGHAAAAGDVVFLMGYNVREEARAIATRAVAFLADPACTNMGILFPGYGALSREVAALLSEQGIALNDTLGYNAPASPEEQAWAAWLALQASPGLETFCRLVRTLPPPRGGVAALEEALDRAFNEVLVDDLGVLTAFMKSSSEKSLQAAASVMARFVLLPPRASLSEFLEATAGALDKLAWSERMADIRCVAAVLAPLVTDAFPRDAYLAWLGELTRFEAWQRDAERVHPFARVHLLTYTKADWQSWSHLILADLNENGWPPPCEDAPFLGERLVAHLNREALGEGSQGEGHVVARPGKSLILGPLQRRAVIQRQFFGLLESVRAGLCVAGAVTDESDPAHRRIPSDFLSHLY
ncbi:MAG: hypothetical protein JXB04_06845, partial [Kiritimatiellae bacterium]|nr:hypothetical protein [Kiritimatiellia bacterium]